MNTKEEFRTISEEISNKYEENENENYYNTRYVKELFT